MGSCISKPKDLPMMLPTVQEIDNLSTLSRKKAANDDIPPPLPKRSAQQLQEPPVDQNILAGSNTSSPPTAPRSKNPLLETLKDNRPISALDLKTAVAPNDIKVKSDIASAIKDDEMPLDYLQPIEDSRPPNKKLALTERQQSKASLTDAKRDQIFSDYVMNEPQKTNAKRSEPEERKERRTDSTLDQPKIPIGYVNAAMIRKAYREQKSPKNKSQSEMYPSKEPRPLPRSSESEINSGLYSTYQYNSAPTTPNMSSRHAEGNGALRKPVPIPRERRGTEPNLRVDPSVTDNHETCPVSQTPRISSKPLFPVNRTTSNNSSVSYSSSLDKKHVGTSGENSRRSSSGRASPPSVPSHASGSPPPSVPSHASPPSVPSHTGLDLSQPIPRSSDSESRTGSNSGYLPMNEQENGQLVVPQSQRGEGSLTDLMALADGKSVALNRVVLPDAAVGANKYAGYLKILPDLGDSQPSIPVNDYYNVRSRPSPSEELSGYININQHTGSSQYDSGVEDSYDAYI